MSPFVMPSSGHPTLLAFEIVTPPIVAPSLTRALPTCTPPASCRRGPRRTPAAATCHQPSTPRTRSAPPDAVSLRSRRAPGRRVEWRRFGAFPLPPSLRLLLGPHVCRVLATT